MKHPLNKLIFDSLVHTPKGFDLDPKKAPLIAKQLKSGGVEATTAFYEVVGMLQVGNGQPAAAALLQLITNPPPVKTGGWGSR